MGTLLEKKYFDITQPSSYGGVSRLHEAIRLSGKKLSKDKIRSFLEEQDAYTLHKPVRKSFKTVKTISYSTDNIWQVDLSDMRRYVSYNDGYNYILFITDVYSRYLWLIPLRTKRPYEIKEVILNLFISENRIPGFIHSDQGLEFLGNEFQKMLKAFNIGYYNTYSHNKASLVERVQRTIKERMHRYFTHKNTYRYIDILDALAKTYNRSVHRMIGTTPYKIAYKSETPFKKEEVVKYTNNPIKVGDVVRVSRSGGHFKKGFEQGWSTEVFTVSKIKVKEGINIYIIKDLKGETIKGSFYIEEIQKIKYNPEKEYKIEKIVKSIGKGRNKKYLVKWIGYPESFNSYINAEDVVSI